MMRLSSTQLSMFAICSLTFAMAVLYQVRQHDSKLVSRKPQLYTTYTLQLQVEGIGSLKEAMDKSFAVEEREVDDDEEVDPATGKPVKHKFEYTNRIVAPPQVLCVQLSRFSFDYSRGVPIKHNHRVEFPMEMDLAEYCEVRISFGVSYRGY